MTKPESPYPATQTLSNELAPRHPNGPTYDLVEAARYLRMSPAVLRQKAKQGLIKGAKPGKCWVFLERDLAAYLDQLYAARGQAPLSDEEKSKCHFSNEAQSGGSVISRPVVSEYKRLLALPTK